MIRVYNHWKAKAFKGLVAKVLGRRTQCSSKMLFLCLRVYNDSCYVILLSSTTSNSQQSLCLHPGSPPPPPFSLLLCNVSTAQGSNPGLVTRPGRFIKTAALICLLVLHLPPPPRTPLFVLMSADNLLGWCRDWSLNLRLQGGGHIFYYVTTKRQRAVWLRKG